MKKIDEEKKIRSKIKYWLDVYEVSRKDLAEKLGVTVDALNGWLATRPFPPARIEEIFAIFRQYEEPERKCIVGTSLSDEEMRQFEAAAKKMGMTKEDLFRHFILKHLREELE